MYKHKNRNATFRELTEPVDQSFFFIILVLLFSLVVCKPGTLARGISAETSNTMHTFGLSFQDFRHLFPVLNTGLFVIQLLHHAFTVELLSAVCAVGLRQTQLRITGLMHLSAKATDLVTPQGAIRGHAARTHIFG